MPTLLDLGLNPERLNELVSKGYISKSAHPKYPLTIYTYTHKTMKEQYWNNYTLMCRGLILENGTYNIIAQPMPKFFNFEDPYRPETFRAKLPKEKPTMLEKLDGSLGILWVYGVDSHGRREFGIATRGSFTSKPALWATAWLKNHINTLHNNGIPFNFTTAETQCFEIISKVTRIVCKYDYEGLVLIARVSKGRYYSERTWASIRALAVQNKMRYVRRSPLSFDACLAEDKKNTEGYIALFNHYDANGRQKTFRVKLKQPSYLKLHKMITNLSPKDVWEMLSSGKDMDAILKEDIPAEFRVWYTKWVERLRREYELAETMAKKAFVSCQHLNGATRKEWADYINQNYKQLAGVLFQMLDKKDYSQTIWKSIKPKGIDSYLNQIEDTQAA